MFLAIIFVDLRFESFFFHLTKEQHAFERPCVAAASEIVSMQMHLLLAMGALAPQWIRIGSNGRVG